MAEVLITLGIIGIVAAMTLPQLIKNYKHKILEAKFKKSYSTIAQASADLAVEFGRCDFQSAENNEIKEYFLSKFVKINRTGYKKYYSKFLTYNKKDNLTDLHWNCLDKGSYRFYPSNIILEDGSNFAFCTHNKNHNLISIDTNGYKKGPNAFGHDIFMFELEQKTCKLKPLEYTIRSCADYDSNCKSYTGEIAPCSRTSTQESNGFSCGLYALRNECPDDKTKTYWECLP